MDKLIQGDCILEMNKLIEQQGTKIEVLNPNDNDEQDLIKDMISIVTFFCCRLYDLRRAKNKRDKIVKVINETED